MTRANEHRARAIALIALASPILASGCHRDTPAATAALLADARDQIQKVPPTSAAAKSAAVDPCACDKDKPAAAVASDDPGETLTIPDVSLVNEDGKTVRFVSDVLKGKVFLINFAFTSCEGVCPLLGANSGQVRRLLSEEKAEDVVMVTVSVDPLTDTPERLKTWSGRFGSGPGWTLVTGPRGDVNRLLKALRVYAADKTQHSQSSMIGDARSFRFDEEGATGEVRRVAGLADPRATVERIRRLREQDGKSAPVAARPSPAEEYFTTWGAPGTAGEKVRRDIVLRDQDGKPLRFYEDLLKDRNVVVHAFFSSCTGACPRMFGAMGKIQDRFGDRVGKDVFLISITVDPKADTPERLRSYADQLHARPGWSFLTGSPEDVEGIVRKLQPEYITKDSHSTRLFIGNLRTHQWAKPDIASSADGPIVEAAGRIWDGQ